MHRGFCGIAALALIPGLSACTTPHHSNALIFGTNTNFGIDVGQNATGTPSILIGYRRQEAVFMPLVANVRYDENGVPTACSVYPGFHYSAAGELVADTPAGAQVPPCFLVGQNGGALDSYSVLASFGAQFSASATNPQANGGLAQFFATGLAAQALAIRGGSSLVAVGQAATVSSANADSGGIEALYNAPEVADRSAAIVQQSQTAQNALREYLRNHATDQDFRNELTALEALATHPGQISATICTATRQDCLDSLGTSLGLSILSLNDVNWPAIIAQRKTARGIS